MTSRILVTGGSGFIGSSLIEELLAEGHDVRSLDLQAPTIAEQAPHWVKGDVLDLHCVQALIQDFKPHQLVHLAAETEIGTPTGELADAYPVNCKSAGVLAQACEGSSLEKCIVVSTQYVCGPTGRQPEGPEDTFPHTRYGESKVVLEQDTRRLLHTPWVIIRPTYIWGPHNRKNFLQLIQSVAAGRYLHPGAPRVLRSYGYVRTVTWTIRQSLGSNVPAGATLYATDPPEDSAIFIQRLSEALGRQHVITVPRAFLRFLGQVGDRFKALPMNSFRYFNMTTDYPVPHEWGRRLLGDPPTDLTRAAQETAEWFNKVRR